MNFKHHSGQIISTHVTPLKFWATDAAVRVLDDQTTLLPKILVPWARYRNSQYPKNGHTTFVMNKKAKIFTIQLNEGMDVIVLPILKRANSTNISDKTNGVCVCVCVLLLKILPELSQIQYCCSSICTVSVNLQENRNHFLFPQKEGI